MRHGSKVSEERRGSQALKVTMDQRFQWTDGVGMNPMFQERKGEVKDQMDGVDMDLRFQDREGVDMKKWNQSETHTLLGYFLLQVKKL